MIAFRLAALAGTDRDVAAGNDELAALGHGIARIDSDVDQRQLEFGNVGLDRPQVGRQVDGERDVSAQRASRAWRAAPRSGAAGRSTTGLSGCRREKVSSWRVRLSPRRAAPRIASMPAAASASVRRRRSISAWPLTIISRLLKSCAMPPVSWPIASIFCAWASCSRVCSSAISACLRSVTSRAIPCIRTAFPASFLIISTRVCKCLTSPFGRTMRRSPWNPVPVRMARCTSSRIRPRSSGWTRLR